MKTLSRFLAFTFLLAAGAAQAQTTAFTYQGILSQSNAPVTGPQDFEFRLFNAVSGGTQQGSTVTHDDLGVTNGLFTATLDFGATVFPGADRFLQIAVRPGASTGAYTNLNPRQPITSAPYAIRAANLTGTLPLAQLPAGVVTNNGSAVTLSGSFTGNGAGLSNVNAATLGGLSSASLWKVNGNAGANPTNGAFLGTTDNLPLEFRVNGARALRLEPNINGAPNVIGGSPSNRVAASVEGATIAGGGLGLFPNQITASYATIGGGTFNAAAGGWATIGGGRDINVTGNHSTVSGGSQNTIQTGADAATIGGGVQNVVQTNASFSTIGGGRLNRATVHEATVAGGAFNSALAFSATIGGGGGNAASGEWSTIAGGRGNVLTNADYATIGGGSGNLIKTSATFSTIPGGLQNEAGGAYAFAAGRRAKANHTGVFAWADSTDADFVSTAANQFLVRASGGVGFGTGNPQAALHLYSASNPATLRLHSAGGFGAARLEFFSDPQGSGAEWRPGYIQSTDNGGFSGGLSFHVNGTGFDNRLGDLEVMRIVDGRVGINTPNPAATLHVNGDASIISLSAFEATAVNLTSTDLLQMHRSSQSGSHTFTGGLGQMLTLGAPLGLFVDGPGLGLQTNNLYFRSAGDYSWFRGGSHRDTPHDPGGFIISGTELMRLSGGYLSVRGDGDEQAYLGGDGAGGDIEIGSRNAGILNAAFWNPAAGMYMNVYAKTFNPTSDRNAKQDFQPVDPAAILEKVVAMPLTEWAYKGETQTRHLGPVAQDFKEAFGLGNSDKSIATVDADGVALAAIQGLNQKLEETRKENSDLKARLEKLERLLGKLAKE